MTLLRRRSFVVIFVTAGLLASAALGGCSMLPSVPGGNPSDSSSESDDSTAESGSDDTVDEELDNPGLNHEVPENFPSEIPLPDLPILLSLDLGTGWSIVYSTDDLEADCADAAAAFDGGGWNVLVSNSADGQCFHAIENDQYQVQISGATKDTGYDSAIISYTVVKKG